MVWRICTGGPKGHSANSCSMCKLCLVLAPRPWRCQPAAAAPPAACTRARRAGLRASGACRPRTALYRWGPGLLRNEGSGKSGKKVAVVASLDQTGSLPLRACCVLLAHKNPPSVQSKNSTPRASAIALYSSFVGPTSFCGEHGRTDQLHFSSACAMFPTYGAPHGRPIKVGQMEPTMAAAAAAALTRKAAAAAAAVAAVASPHRVVGDQPRHSQLGVGHVVLQPLDQPAHRRAVERSAA